MTSRIKCFCAVNAPYLVKVNLPSVLGTYWASMGSRVLYVQWPVEGDSVLVQRQLTVVCGHVVISLE